MRRIAMALLMGLLPATALAQDTQAAAPQPDLRLALATSVEAPAGADVAGPPLPRPIADAVESEWLARASMRRPAGLGVLYASLAGLNALDTYSTVRAMNRGAEEVNPVMARTGGSPAASLAIKAATTATAVYFSEKLWKKNRAAAIATMIAVNAGTAMVVARNFRNARGQ